MNIHKFNTKPKEKQHKTIKWMVPADIRQHVEKVNGNTWKIFSHESISLEPKEVKHLSLGIGFMMSEVVLTSLANSLCKKRCSIQNEVNLEDTTDITAVITNNNSKEIVNIQENDLLFLVCYKKI